MPGHAQPSGAAQPAPLGANKGIKFQIKTGGKTWACTLQDRQEYERTKAAKTGEPTEGKATESTPSSSSASTKSS